MSASIIVLIIQIMVLVLSFIMMKHIIPKLSSNSISDSLAKVQMIITYADKFVSWADHFLSDSSGERKMLEVVNQLNKVSEKYGIEMSQEELIAIAQKAYYNFKANKNVEGTKELKIRVPYIPKNKSIDMNRDINIVES